MLNVVRRLVNSEGRAPRDPNIGKMGARKTRPSDSFTTADVYAFERELENLHADNPVNNRVTRGKPACEGQPRKRLRLTGQEFASNFKSSATWDC